MNNNTTQTTKTNDNDTDKNKTNDNKIKISRPNRLTKYRHENRSRLINRKLNLNDDYKIKNINKLYESHIITARDNIKLKGTLYRSINNNNNLKTKKPLIIIKSAYFRKNLDSVLFAELLVERNYNVLCMDVRGRFSSDGNINNLM